MLNYLHVRRREALVGIFLHSAESIVHRDSDFGGSFRFLRPRTHAVKKVPESHKFDSNLTQNPLF